MATQRFLVAPIKFGEQRNVRPWVIPDDAFDELNNAYIWRGRVLKRHGSILMGNQGQISSRVRILVGTTDGAGNLGATLVPGTIWAVGQAFSVGSQIFYVYQSGAMHPGVGTGTGTFNTGTGMVTIAGADPLTSVYYYPAEPIMGLYTLESPIIDNEITIAFDTQFAYQFLNNAWERLGVGAGAALWTGNNADFFWGTNYRGITNDQIFFYVTNYTTGDAIKYWDPNAATWTTTTPAIVPAPGTDTLLTAKIILPFQNRLIAFNTIENIGGTPTTFANRCRFTWPFSPVDPSAWIASTGFGGFIDNPINEEIVSAEVVKNRLIVYLEESVWELVYTNNEIYPYLWQQINNELGAESTFSVVPFDKVALAIGETGINACNGANVERIDEIIPDAVFNIRNSQEGLIRVHGIRDYFTEQVFWTYADQEHTETFPNKLIVYDYKQGNWAFFDDSITTFGYFRKQVGLDWQNLNTPWQQYIFPWGSGFNQQLFRDVVAGNQEGWTFLIAQQSARNSPSLQISDISATSPANFTIINHNISGDSAILLEGLTGSVELVALNNRIYAPVIIDSNTIQLASWNEANQGFDSVDVTTAYEGGGTASLVSKIDIKTKVYNFFAAQARNSYIPKIDFLIGRQPSQVVNNEIVGGEVAVYYFLDNSPINITIGGQLTNTALGNNILQLYAYPGTQEATLFPDFLWHTVYFQASGNYIQFQITYDDDQLYNFVKGLAYFDLEALVIYAQPTGRLE